MLMTLDVMRIVISWLAGITLILFACMTWWYRPYYFAFQVGPHRMIMRLWAPGARVTAKRAHGTLLARGALTDGGAGCAQDWLEICLLLASALLLILAGIYGNSQLTQDEAVRKGAGACTPAPSGRSHVS